MESDENKEIGKKGRLDENKNTVKKKGKREYIYTYIEPNFHIRSFIFVWSENRGVKGKRRVFSLPRVRSVGESAPSALVGTI